MWEEDSSESSFRSATDGQESARENVVDTDEEAELYSYIHHEHAIVDQTQLLGKLGNSKRAVSKDEPSPSFLSLLDSQRHSLEPKGATQSQNKPSAGTSVYGNRIYEVVRGKIKSWSKPESSILNWLGDGPEKSFNKSQVTRSGRSVQNDNQVCPDPKKSSANPGVKLSVEYQVTDSTVNSSPFNSCARLESSAVNWMRDVSCNGAKLPKSPNLNVVKDSQLCSDSGKTAKSQNSVKVNSSDINSEDAEKNNHSKLRSGNVANAFSLNAANDPTKKSPKQQSKVESNARAASLPYNNSPQQAKIAPFITSPTVLRGSTASLHVGSFSFSMDGQPNDKLNNKKKTKGQKVAFVTPLTDVGQSQRNMPNKGEAESFLSKSNLSVTVCSNKKTEACDSKYSYSGKRSAKHSSPERVVEYASKQAKHQRTNSGKANIIQNKNALTKKGERLIVDFCDEPKEVIDLFSTSSDASCTVIPDSEASSDVDSVRSGKQQVNLPMSIAIHIGETGRTVVRNTSSESTIQEPKIKKRKVKHESKKSSSSKATRKSNLVDGLVKNTESMEEIMRKFYDSENSDVDDGHRSVTGRNRSGLDSLELECIADWSVLDVDRHANIKASNRYFVGFDQKQKLFCGNCKQRGHVMRTCPEPKRILHCTLCGEPYHKAEVCFEMTCSRCLRRGHNTDSCQVSSKYLDPPCNLCWMPGHMEDQCPDYWRRYYLTTKVGPIVKGNTTDSKTPSCYNCASKFHWGYECRKPRMCPDIYPNYPFVVSYEQPHPPRSKNHNSNRLTAGRDRSDHSRVEKEIFRLVTASNYVWQQESAQIRRSFKRIKGEKRMTVEERRKFVEERRKVKQDAKVKKRLVNAQQSLDERAEKKFSGTNKKKKRKGPPRNWQNNASVTTANETLKPNTWRNKVGNHIKLNQRRQFRNRNPGSDSSFFQEAQRVNKNSIGRKRARNRELHSRPTGATTKGKTEVQNRNRKRKKKL